MNNRNTHQGWLIGLMLISLLFVQIDSIKAQKRVKKAEDDVELVCAGNGKTLDEAVKMALRSGLEQTYGTFVSANTTIINDDLIKDEIVSLSTGNVRGYEIVSKNQSSNGTWNAVVKAVFSTGKLVSYVKSKGGSTELAGGLFAMYAKMEKMNEEVEVKIIQNLRQQIIEIAHQAFDFDIQVEEPVLNQQPRFYRVPITIECRANKNVERFKELYTNTTTSIALKPEEVLARKNAGLPIYIYAIEQQNRINFVDGKKHTYSPDNTAIWRLHDDGYKGMYYGVYQRFIQAKTQSEFEDFIEWYEDTYKKSLLFFRTKALDNLISNELDLTSAFIVSDGKRNYVGGQDIKRPDASHFIYNKTLFTKKIQKGTLIWWDTYGYVLKYKDLEEISEIKRITILPKY